MAGSDTPPFRSYLRAAKSGPSAVGLDNESSSDDEAAAPVSVTKTGSQPRSIPRSVSIQSNIYLCVLLQEMENIQMVLLSFLIFEVAWQFFRVPMEHFLLHPSTCHCKPRLWDKPTLVILDEDFYMYDQ